MTTTTLLCSRIWVGHFSISSHGKKLQLTSNMVEVTSFLRILRYFQSLKSFLQVCRCRNKLSIPCEFIQNDTCLEEYGESDRAHKMKEKSFQVGVTLQKETYCQRDFFQKEIDCQKDGLDPDLHNTYPLAR